MAIFQKGPGFRSGIKDFPKHVNAQTITCGLISSVFGCTGPCLITIQAAQTAGFTDAQMVSWIFGIYAFGGILGMLLSCYYKMPISGAYSIPGATMMGAALMGYTFQEAAFAFVLAGVIVLIVGLTGAIGKIMRWLPMPIVMGMVAGALMKFGSNLVVHSVNEPIICGLAVAAFLVVPRFFKKFPGIVAAMLVGVIATIVLGRVETNITMPYYFPQFVVPKFNAALILSCAIPLAALVMGAENAQAMGVLQAQGYKVPANAMTFWSGVGGIVSGLVGAHNANIAGPMTAICSSDDAGPKEGRYAASIINGFTFAAWGFLGSYAIGLVKIIPGPLVGTLAGLAMINVLISSLKETFGTGKFRMAGFAAFAVALSGVSILQIGSAFWALVIGVIVALIADNKDFADAIHGAKDAAALEASEQKVITGKPTAKSSK